jgi:hypothetical protein
MPPAESKKWNHLSPPQRNCCDLVDYQDEYGASVKLVDIGETIAVRKFTLASEEGLGPEVSVLLGKTKQLPDHDDWYCPYQIKGVGDEKVRYRGGIDAFQALQLAIRALGVELDVLNQGLGGKLKWEGDEKGWLGFPDPPGT